MESDQIRRITRLEITQSDALQRLAALETTVEKDHEAVFGNGQPGEIEMVEQRLKRLEKVVWMVMGGAICLEIMHAVPALLNLVAK